MSWRLHRLAAATGGRLAAPFLRIRRPTPADAFVLAYHRIGVPGDSKLDHALWNASAEQFATQIRWLKARADIVPLLELPDALARGKGRFVAITFDDGYRDNYTTAFPILRDLGATATFFVSTGFVDAPKTPWWDEIAWILRTTVLPDILVQGSDVPVSLAGPRNLVIQRVLRRAKRVPGGDLDEFVAALARSAGTGRIPEGEAPAWVNWHELREMQVAGMDIGGHTVHHPVLGLLKPDAQYHELHESHDRITAECGKKFRAMSYPVGGYRAYDRATQDAARMAGWQMACNYKGGYLAGEIPNPFDVPRIAMQPYTRLSDLAAAFAWPVRFS